MQDEIWGRGRVYMKIKECCYNCHYLVSGDSSSCKGMKDFDNKCHEYLQNMYRDNNNEGLWVTE